ncbi:MAG: antitoxin component YwqK of YwqJK toxin-antitoxin module [Crocinitomicaceae bacterium]|jgi:antitoxin component YwqK of YwqJK toxin-antitoxin module
MKQGRWVYYGKDRPESGYPENGKMEEGPYVNNRKEGLWIRYYNDGVTPKLKGEYHNNRPHGLYTKYFKNGNIKEQGTFSHYKYGDNFARYLEDRRPQENRTTLEDGNKIDSFFYYFNSKCLDSIVIYNHSDNRIETITYSKESCDSILQKKSSNTNRVCHLGDDYFSFEYKPQGPEDNLIQQVNPPIIERNKVFVLKISDSLTSHKSIDSRRPYNAHIYESVIMSSDSLLSHVHSVFSKGRHPEVNGYNRLYNVNDEIYIDGEFSNGTFINGKVYIYDSDGILLNVSIFKKGKYFADGQL